MSSDFDKIIRDFSSYFGITVKELTWDENKRVPILKTDKSKEPLQGLNNIVAKAQNSHNLSPEHRAIQDQWVEYGFNNRTSLDGPSNAAHVLKELNEYMADKVYFVGNAQGPADILMYYSLYNVISNLSFQEKEKYLHACRWFNNIQQDERARLGRPVVHFSRTRLYV